MAVKSPVLPSRYRDAKPVGRGGMAEIFRATDGELGRTVAVKVLAEHCSEDTEIRKRFLSEGRAAARLSGDPNTVTIYDVGETDGRPYIVMEYFPGGSLANRIAAGPVDRLRALEWLEQAAGAHDAAHERGVVHRDVKPGNLLLDKDDNIYVADFGIASAAGVDSNTQTGVILGTAGYLAPEQATGVRAVPASDQYALAVVAYELLTGTRPGPVPSKKLPEPAHRVFARALAEEPEERYPSCLDFVAALESALVDPSRVIPPQTVVVRRRHPRSSRRIPLTIAAILLGLLAFFLTAALSSGNSSSPPPTVVQTVTVPAQATAPTTAPSTPVQPIAQSQPATPGKAKGKKKDRKAKREKPKKDKKKNKKG
jgi:serine/threonine-protein kinase